MTFTRIQAVFILGLILCGPDLCAHPGHDHHDGTPPSVRRWKGTDGLFELEASFVLARDEKVLLETLDGVQVLIPLEKLGRDDRDWVRQRVQQIHQLNKDIVSRAAEPSVPRIARTANSANLPLPPAFVIVSVTIALSVLALIAFRARQQRYAVPLAVLFGSPLFVLAAYSAHQQAGDAEKKSAPPAIAADFQAFKDKLKFRWSDSHFFVESNGLPDHPMMVGITAWQQQVPLPQPYTGKNAWQIPLKPKLAEKPISAKKALYRGAIALAVNGVPIFNALNNRGADAFLIGELDEYGGHCGKGDDYHYHIAPLHLEKIVGKDKPIAYALDGFPLFGLTDEKLDEFNGRFDKDGNYRYHSSKTYPYINGGMRGVVEVRNDGIDPQPNAGPVRPAGLPLRGAKITGFTVDDGKKNFSLKYEVQGKTRKIDYKVNDNGTFTFVFIDDTGTTKTETYTRREKGPGKKGDDKKGDEKKKKGKGPDKGEPRADPPPAGKAATGPMLKVTSPAFEKGGNLPAEFTCDGKGISPPIEWNGGPAGTKCYALQLWHVPKDGGFKSYWVIYNIRADVTSLPKNAKGIGKLGVNDKKKAGYDPMCSKGPGAKEYHVTVYALSAEPNFTSENVTRSDLLAAVKDITLAEGTLTFKYERSE
jgi:Raf kinase inhibitor-like YbhB/YbcL family protein